VYASGSLSDSNRRLTSPPQKFEQIHMLPL
jgi:hypothetical protein